MFIYGKDVKSTMELKLLHKNQILAKKFGCQLWTTSVQWVVFDHSHMPEIKYENILKLFTIFERVKTVHYLVYKEQNQYTMT